MEDDESSNLSCSSLTLSPIVRKDDIFLVLASCLSQFPGCCCFCHINLLPAVSIRKEVFYGRLLLRDIFLLFRVSITYSGSGLLLGSFLLSSKTTATSLKGREEYLLAAAAIYLYPLALVSHGIFCSER